MLSLIHPPPPSAKTRYRKALLKNGTFAKTLLNTQFLVKNYFPKMWDEFSGIFCDFCRLNKVIGTP